MEIVPESRLLEASVARCARNPGEINGVLFEQRGTRQPRQAKKIEKFFGKHVILAHGEPRLSLTSAANPANRRAVVSR